MVAEAKKATYLRGAALADIHADPFDLKELRKTPRLRDDGQADLWWCPATDWLTAWFETPNHFTTNSLPTRYLPRCTAT